MSKKNFRPDVDAPEWKGGHTPYDIIKEGTIAIVIVGLLTVLLSVLFGSPDVPAITIKSWSNARPSTSPPRPVRTQRHLTDRILRRAVQHSARERQPGPRALKLEYWVACTSRSTRPMTSWLTPEGLPNQPALDKNLAMCRTPPRRRRPSGWPTTRRPRRR